MVLRCYILRRISVYLKFAGSTVSPLIPSLEETVSVSTIHCVRFNSKGIRHYSRVPDLTAWRKKNGGTIWILGDLGIYGFENLRACKFVSSKTWELEQSRICKFGVWNLEFGNLEMREFKDLGILKLENSKI